ncbi:response regulator [Caenispirillum bisanense]|uniref:response regulator n=1 Tax=Caenispirillum bisanense TaxID=414052 RepID=UPI0031E24C58
MVVDAALPDGSELPGRLRLAGTDAGAGGPLKVLLLGGIGGSPHAARRDADAVLARPLRQSVFLRLAAAVVSGRASAPPEAATEPSLMPAPVEADCRLRILVAEDNPVNQQVAQRILERLGHHVDVAANGLEAVEAVCALPYDLVFMDMQMPELDGLAATRRIRALETAVAAIPIVAMTANALPSDRERCLEAGMNDYVSKPINAMRLAEVIARVAALPAPAPAPAPQADAEQPAPPSPPAAEAGDAILLDHATLEELEQQLPAELVRDLLATCLSEADGFATTIAAAAAIGDLDQVEYAAHSLKGSASNFGLRALAGVAHRLQAAAAAGPADVIPHLAAELHRTLQRSRTAVEDRLRSA